MALDIEEAILQLAWFGLERDQVEQRSRQEMLIVYPTPKNLQVVSFLQMVTIIYLLVVYRVFLVASATVTMGTRSLPLSTSKKNARFRERKRFSNNFFHSAEVKLGCENQRFKWNCFDFQNALFARLQP